MWQVLLAAALAGSTTLVAKHFLNHPEKFEQQEKQPIASAFDSPEVQVVHNSNGSGCESNCEQGIFRFSSLESSTKKIRSSRKKMGMTCRRLKFRDENGSVDERSSGKRFAVCLKKRRTGKTRSVPAKPGSCASKDGSLFGWGLGVGIMYMMSAGKAEISKLSTAMDETAQVVQELRAELYKKKSTTRGSADSKNVSSVNNKLLLNRSSTEDRNPNDIKVPGLIVTDDAECPSSVLTDEPEPVLEMVQLEAELESELQKLPWSAPEDAGHNTIRPTLDKTQVSSERFYEMVEQSAVSYECHGVFPSELDQKLSHLLIEQQENQILELESELHSAQSKLHEKEAELQALKDCVRRLSNFSLTTASDDEAEEQVEQEGISGWDTDGNSKKGFELRKPMVGMKRPIASA